MAVTAYSILIAGDPDALEAKVLAATDMSPVGPAMYSESLRQWYQTMVEGTVAGADAGV